jgi:arabinofuranosyltransferase
LNQSDRFGAELIERYSRSVVEAAPWTGLAVLTVALTAPLFLRPEKGVSQRLRLLLAIPIALAAMAWSYHYLWYGDDAFISFRYARNLAEGNGLVFNPGERVEGYTNFLWTVIIAIGMKVGISPLISSLVLSLASYAAIIFFLTWLVDRLAPTNSVVIVSLAAVATAQSYIMASFGTSGLETMFAAALALGMLVSASLKRFALAGTLGILATLSHPDHLLYYAALGLALLLDPETLRRPLVWWTDKERRRQLLGFAAPFFLLFLPYFLGRWAYYGQFYPNTYYAKSGSIPYFSQGVRYLVLSLVEGGAYVALPLALVAASARWVRLEARYFLVVTPLMCFYVAKIGGDFMLGRLFVALLPVVFLFAELAVRDIMVRDSAKLKALGFFAAAGLLLSTLPARVVKHGEKFWHVTDEGSFFRATEPTEKGVKGHYLAGRAADLNEYILRRDIDPLMGIGNVGIVGYLAPVRIRDLLALTDRDVAHMPITIRTRPGHEKVARGPFMLGAGVDLSDDPIFPDPYTQVGVVRVNKTDYFMTGYKPELVAKMRKVPRIRLPQIERYIDRYDAATTRGDEFRLACDLWYQDEFYFRYNKDEARRSHIIQSVRTAYPSLGDAVELALSGSTSFKEHPLFQLSDAEGWKNSGKSFALFPTTTLVPDQGFTYGQSGSFANSFGAPGADTTQGRLVGKPFRIEGDAITLWVGGGLNPQNLYVALVVDGKPVRRATGCNSEALGKRVWNVADLRGKEAHLEIVDRESGGWGHILVDSVSQWSRN